MHVSEHTKITLKDQITLKLGSISLTGELIYQVVRIVEHDTVTYSPLLVLQGSDDGEGMPFVEQLTLRPETVGGAAPTSPPGEHGHPAIVAVKDYSEHTGLADSLVEAGVAEILFITYVGPFDSPVKHLQVKMAGAA